jgi:rhodanese-related sulfurtransferase
MATTHLIGNSLQRLARREDAFMVPEPVTGEPERFIVDGTWGSINPIELAPGVRTVGELEVIAHIQAGLPVVDSRRPGFFAAGTIPPARSVPHTETVDHLSGFDRAVDTVLFCNGPQCAATPQAIRALLDAGYPAERLLYYRGGMHDWLTLGLPSVPGVASATKGSTGLVGAAARERKRSPARRGAASTGSTSQHPGQLKRCWSWRATRR